MAIYLRELIRNRTALIVWTVTMILFSVFLMTFFPTIREQAVELQKLMEQYPKELVAAFNFDRLANGRSDGILRDSGVYLYYFVWQHLCDVIVYQRTERRKRTYGRILADPTGNKDESVDLENVGCCNQHHDFQPGIWHLQSDIV
ncbi:MAG: hypothetical protein MZU95_16030 [Desulfomicrobium escambiense]|nr:hypothetical protein [Desulfomicrobium escambiense]